MKFKYKIFHIDSDSERDSIFKVANMAVSKNAEELITPTIQIRSEEDLSSFYAHNPDFNIDPNGYNLDSIQGWKMGELGIWASNYTAWKNFLKTDAEYLILMEDDIVIKDNFFELLEKYLSEIRIEWDLFSFFIPSDQFPSYKDDLSISENVCRAYQDWSCACYILTRRGAEKALINMNPPVSLPLDWYFYRQKHKFTSLTVKPSSDKGCTLAPLQSTFQAKHERKIINGIF